MYIIRRKGDNMKRIIINEENIDTNKMDETVIRVKALMINKKEELLVVSISWWTLERRRIIRRKPK